MTTLDWLIILGYFTSLAGLTWWVIRKNKDTADDYFLASRNLGWFIVGASIFASNIGSEHLVGLAGAGGGRAYVYSGRVRAAEIHGGSGRHDERRGRDYDQSAF